MIVGLALAATTSYADTKPAPVGTSAAKLAQQGRPADGSSTATKARAKVVTRSPVAKVKIRTKAKAAPARRVARKAAPVRSYRAAKVVRTVPRRVAPVRTYRAAKAVRTVAKRAPRPATVRPRISTVQRKATAPTGRVVRQATASKNRLAQRPKSTLTKINKVPSKIIKSSAGKVAAAKRGPSTELAKAAQSGPIKASVELTVTDSAVVTAAAKVSVLSVEASVSPVRGTVPLLNLPPVTLPPAELPSLTLPRTDPPRVPLPPSETPTVSLPPTDPLTVSAPGSPLVMAAQLPQAGERAAPGDGTVSTPTAQQTTRTPPGILAGAGTTVVAALTASRPPLPGWAALSIGPPAVAVIDQLGQRFRTAQVSDSVGQAAAALVLAAAIGAAATGTAGSGSTGASGLAVLSAALHLAALGGSRRLRGRLRESGFRRLRVPGFSPD